jgi:hypothetical protein
MNSVLGTSAIATTAYNPDAVDHLAAGTAHVAQFVSETLPPQVVAAQTVKLQMRALEANASNELRLAWKLYAVSEDGLTVLGTLISLRVGTMELGIALTNRSETALISSLVLNDKFRLVLEVGVSGTPIAATGVQGHNSSFSFGEVATSDLPEDNAAIGSLNPWLQFPINLKFGIGANVAFSSGFQCAGGGHVHVDMSVNNSPEIGIVFDTDALRQPIVNLTPDDWARFADLLLKVHFASKQRVDIVSELTAPGGLKLVI